MPSSTSNSDFRWDAETYRRAFRRWWIALGCALVVAPLFAAATLRWQWSIITLGELPATFAVSDLVSAKGLFLMALPPLLVLLVLAGLWVQQRMRFWSVELLAVLLALGTLAAMEILIRVPRIQTAFLLAVNIRLSPDAWATREPLQQLLHGLHPPPAAEAAEGVALYGSSQVVMGLDGARLSEITGRPVYRRAVAGMSPIEMCSAQDRLSTPPAKIAVLYLSPFDMASRVYVQTSWMRPLITPRGWRALLPALGPDIVVHTWRDLVELGWSARCRSWALRDYTRILLTSPWGSPASSNAMGVADTAPAVSSLMIDPVYVEASFRALETMLKHLREEGFSVVAFEGEVNPAFRKSFPDDFWNRTQDRVQATLRSCGARYVPLSSYQPEIQADEWHDHTHVDERGRGKLTHAIADYLTAEWPTSPASP